MSEKIEVNKKAVGKTAKVLDRTGEWEGEIVGVKDEETFLVKNLLIPIPLEVSIFDLRYN